MVFRLKNLNRSTRELAPGACSDCAWWQGFDDGWDQPEQAEQWARQAEETLGGWGKLALADGRLLGLIQFGPATIFPRVSQLCPGPRTGDPVFFTCSMVTSEADEPARKSLMLAALADLQQLETGTAEAFCYKEPGKDMPGHLFDREFLRGCGFRPVRSAGNVQLMRLELGGLQPSKPLRHSTRHRILERIKRPASAPAPATLCRRYHRRPAAIRVCSRG